MTREVGICAQFLGSKIWMLGIFPEGQTESFSITRHAISNAGLCAFIYLLLPHGYNMVINKQTASQSEARLIMTRNDGIRQHIHLSGGALKE